MRVRLLGQEFLRIVSPVCTQRDFRRDLENHKVDFVAMCPTYTVDEFEASNPGYKNKGAWESVRRGRTEGLHLLGSRGDPENNRGCLVVDFGQIFSLPPGYLEKKAGDSGGRWRLDSPFLEHFSQAFARYFMRVADARAANCFVHDVLTGNFLEYRFTKYGPNWAQAYAGHYHSLDRARCTTRPTSRKNVSHTSLCTRQRSSAQRVLSGLLHARRASLFLRRHAAGGRRVPYPRGPSFGGASSP